MKLEEWKGQNYKFNKNDELHIPCVCVCGWVVEWLINNESVNNKSTNDAFALFSKHEPKERELHWKEKNMQTNSALDKDAKQMSSVFMRKGRVGEKRGRSRRNRKRE